MQLSVIIVNYNVRFFLEQCLCAVQNAIRHFDAEVIVVDNNSTDDSVSYLQPKFPWVQFIANKKNVGFGKANNQAVALAKGEYVLFLNPDTLMPEDCFERCYRFMKSHPEAGGLGIKMVDGGGHFLKESKRGFPSPLTSLFKLTGLSAIFPKNKLFAKYHLGYLSENESHEVDVLAGAFIMMPRNVIDKAGGAFDEVFFMYGEDVDLSYRIQQAGYKNYYFSESEIIHFKGESTKKGSLNYVRMFYQAMSLFVKKHYGGKKAALFNLLIQVAIFFRAMLSAVASFVKWIGLPLIDAVIVLTCLYGIEHFWFSYIKPEVVLIPLLVTISFPAFTLLFILSGSIAGLYDKWYRPMRAFYAMMTAVIINLAVYSLLDEAYRFSRSVILFGGILAAFTIILLRWVMVKAGLVKTTSEEEEYRQTLIAASEAAYNEAVSMMENAGRGDRVLGRIAISQSLPENAVTSLSQLDVLLDNIPVKEIIFCIDDQLAMAKVISLLNPKRQIRYKFHYYKSQSLVGSDSKETSGETLLPGMAFKIAQPQNRRFKRMADIGWCLLFLLTFPVHFIGVKKPVQFFKNLLLILGGKKAWVGYVAIREHLPAIKAGVLTPFGKPAILLSSIPEKTLETIDDFYARNYDWTEDTKIMLKGYRWLGHSA